MGGILLSLFVRVRFLFEENITYYKNQMGVTTLKTLIMLFEK